MRVFLESELINWLLEYLAYEDVTVTTYATLKLRQKQKPN